MCIEALCDLIAACIHSLRKALVALMAQLLASQPHGGVRRFGSCGELYYLVLSHFSPSVPLHYRARPQTLTYNTLDKLRR